MKKLITSALILSFFLSAFAFINIEVFDDIVFAIKSGNSKELSRYFNSRVELKINDEENIYSNTQAEMILKNFFEKNQPENFVVRHKGSSTKGLPYLIGDLITSNGNYRTYILFKDIDEKYYIQELQFDKE